MKKFIIAYAIVTTLLTIALMYSVLMTDTTMWSGFQIIAVGISIGLSLLCSVFAWRAV